MSNKKLLLEMEGSIILENSIVYLVKSEPPSHSGCFHLSVATLGLPTSILTSKGPDGLSGTSTICTLKIASSLP